MSRGSILVLAFLLLTVGSALSLGLGQTAVTPDERRRRTAMRAFWTLPPVGLAASWGRQARYLIPDGLRGPCDAGIFLWTGTWDVAAGWVVVASKRA
jgi:hypothetical protein